MFVVVIFIERGRPWLPTTLTMFSTSSNFNLVDAQMFDDVRQHTTVFACSIFLRLLLSICSFGVIRHTVWLQHTLELMNKGGLTLHTGKCMSSNVTSIADTFHSPYVYTMSSTRSAMAVFLVLVSLTPDVENLKHVDR